MSIQEDTIREFLRVNGKHLHHREGQELEFKEQFNLAGLAEYFRDFAAFANNRGGYLVFGVTDYGGRTQKIQHAELELIISRRIELNNAQWLDLMKKIGKAGPSNAAILDTEKSLIEKDDSRILVLDDSLAKKLKFIKEGHFSVKKGATALKLVGDVVPVDKIEVIKKVKENLIKDYPYSAAELAAAVKKQMPDAGQNVIWDVIKENDLKNNRAYSAYNFRNKMHEDGFQQTGKLPSVTPSIYNDAAVEFIVKVIRNAPKAENQAAKI